MTNWREYSRLPAEPEYWEQLARRIERQRDAGRSWLRAASAVALLSAAAAVLAFLIPTPAATTPTLLAPTDPVARAVMNRPQPPELADLLVTYDEARR